MERINHNLQRLPKADKDCRGGFLTLPVRGPHLLSTPESLSPPPLRRSENDPVSPLLLGLVQGLVRPVEHGRQPLAAGDGALDAELLSLADESIRPAHGELHSLGWISEGTAITSASGASAADEILTWLRRRAEELTF